VAGAQAADALVAVARTPAGAIKMRGNNHQLAGWLHRSPPATVAGRGIRSPVQTIMNVNQSLPQIPGSLSTSFGPSTSTPRARPSRSSSEGALQELAKVRGGTFQQREKPTGHRRTASFPVSMQDQNAPALHELIGREKAGQLDARFGSLQPAFKFAPGTTDGIKDWEREGGVSTGKPLMHERRIIISDVDRPQVDLTTQGIRRLIDLEALKRGEKTYNWTVSSLGRVFIGEAEPAGVDPQTGK
jgi:hypothetical protein